MDKSRLLRCGRGPADREEGGTRRGFVKEETVSGLALGKVPGTTSAVGFGNAPVSIMAPFGTI